MLVFRDRLRSTPYDRAQYERAKRGLAARTWAYVQDHADATSTVVEEIIARAQGSDPSGRAGAAPREGHDADAQGDGHLRPLHESTWPRGEPAGRGYP